VSDIVERLATARNMIELERAASDAIDEIERLRGLLLSWAMAWDDAAYPEVLADIVRESRLDQRTNEALGRVPKPD
jgi:hypothetical protein